MHKTAASLLLCYVDHNDKAYQCAERRRLETHPKTDAAQLVEIRERFEEHVVPKYIEVAKPAPAEPLLFVKRSDDELLSLTLPGTTGHNTYAMPTRTVSTAHNPV